jgi:hypothetical protein
MERCFLVPFGAILLWCVAVLLGMIGLGRIVALAVGGEPAKKAGWGLHAVWGAALYLFAGGLLGVFKACVDTNMILMTVLGVGLFIWTTFGAWRPVRADFAAISWGVWPAFAAVALIFASGIFRQTYVHFADDLPAYYNFCENLLTTGSFDDPFSWRRLASLGGHTLLQCSILARGSWANNQAFEAALCPAILFGLILGFRGGALARSWFGAPLALIVVTTPILHMNTTSHLTGTIFFVGLFVTLDLVDRGEARRLRLLAASGLVAAGLCSLRAQDVGAAGIALGLFWLGSWIKDKRPAREAWIEAACWGGSLFVTLLPWMIMSYHSSGSPLFPLFQGNNSLAFNPQRVDMPLFGMLKFMAVAMTHPSVLPLLLCLGAAPFLRPGLAASAVAASAVLTSLLLTYGLNLAPDPLTIPRYIQPLLLAGVTAVLATGALAPRRRWLAPAMAALLLLPNLEERTSEFAVRYPALFQNHGMRVPANFNSGVVANYRDAQLLIPEGKRVLVCADFPFLFDHVRNPIWIIDLPHAASPAPGLPYRKPPEETKRYLRALGVDYVIFPSFSNSLDLYNRGIWQRHATGDVPLWRIQAPYFLDFYDTVEGLAASETTLGREGELTVIQFKP